MVGDRHPCTPLIHVCLSVCVAYTSAALCVYGGCVRYRRQSRTHCGCGCMCDCGRTEGLHDRGGAHCTDTGEVPRAYAVISQR